MDLIASGRDADVYALDDDRVLRRYREPDATCERESLVMEWVRGQGYPVPRVFSSDGPDMVLERLHGPTMLASVLAGTTSIDDAGQTMAELLDRLHSLEAPPGARAGHAVRHLDFHPFNIIESPTGPVVIDWRNSDTGPAAVDTALTQVILAQVTVVPLQPEELAPLGMTPDELAVLARRLLAALQRHTGAPADDDVTAAVRLRARDPNMSPAERAALAEVPGLLRGTG